MRTAKRGALRKSNMKKNVTKALAVVAAVAMVSMTSVSAFAQTTTGNVNGTANEQTTTATADVKYTVTEGYTWTIHAAIDFGKDAGAESKTVEKDANKVEVSKNVIPDGKTLKITVEGSGTNGAFTIVNKTTSLSYAITKDNTTISPKGEVLSLKAGTNKGDASLKYTLTTTTGSAEVAGDYAGTVTYTASVVDTTPSSN